MSSAGNRTAGGAESARGLRVILAGGGTGGHVFCALAIAEGLRARFPNVDLLWVDADGGAAAPAARDARIPVETVWVSGIARAMGLGPLLRNLVMPLKLLVSWWQVRTILERFHPHVVVGVGGYASGPMVAVAARAGIPTLIHEANVRPGIANGLLSRWVDVICLGFESASAYFPVGHTVFTGNPIRNGLSTLVSPAHARATFGLAPGGKTLLVMGGSLGARHLNAWVLGNRRQFAARGVQVLWQSGRAHFVACQRELAHAEGVRLVPFIDDIATAYATADLVLASAGALTLAELAVLEKPAILVPDRNVSEDHQTSNAQELQRRGAAICHAGELDGDGGDSLFELVAAVIHDQERLRLLGTEIGRLGNPDAATRIVAEVARLAGLGLAAPTSGGDA